MVAATSADGVDGINTPMPDSVSVVAASAGGVVAASAGGVVAASAGGAVAASAGGDVTAPAGGVDDVNTPHPYMLGVGVGGRCIYCWQMLCA